MTSDLILSRLRRLIMLDTTVFPEVRDDRSFTLIVAGLAAGAGFVLRITVMSLISKPGDTSSTAPWSTASSTRRTRRRLSALR